MKLVRGVGYNSGGAHIAREGGRNTHAYTIWCCMLNRCYSAEYHARSPTYKDCTVCDDWHNFQNFAEWYMGNEFYGFEYDLDKDLLIQGNKIYSPDTCCLVPKELNTLLNSCSNARGEHPRGVYFNKARGRYLARFSAGGVSQHLGYFYCPQRAYRYYVRAKEAYVKEVANKYRKSIDPRIYEILMTWTVED